MPQHRILERERRLARDPAQAAGQPGAGPRRHGAERRADSGDGHREVPAALRRRMEGPPEHAGHPRGDSVRAPARATCARSAPPPRGTSASPSRPSFPGPPITSPRRSSSGCGPNSAMRSGVSGCWAACPAAAWASSSPRSRRRRRKSACRRSCPPPSANCSTRCRLRWSRWSMISPSTSAARSPTCWRTSAALMPPGYYTLTVPALLRQDRHALVAVAPGRAGQVRRGLPHPAGAARHGADALRCHAAARQGGVRRPIRRSSTLLEEHGFDRVQHEQIRADLKEGRIGLAQNRLPASAVIEDVQGRRRGGRHALGSRRLADLKAAGLAALKNGEVAVVTLAAGRGQPLDAGGGRGQGAASVLQAGRRGIAPSSRRTWPRAAASRARPALPFRTSSPPAT